MSKFRGIDGLVVLGGAIKGSPLINGAVAHLATSANLDGSVALQGVVRPGDTFTVAGDAQVYTIVTGGVIDPAAHTLAPFTFTPGVVPGGGWADNAAIAFASNSVANALDCTLETARTVMDTTVLGDAARTIELDLPMWKGTANAFLDNGDAKQAALIAQIKGGATATSLAMLLRIAAGQQFWGDVDATNMRIASEKGAMVKIAYSFEGNGALTPNWN